MVSSRVPRKFPVELLTKAVQLYDGGLSFVEVAALTGISVSYSKNLVKASGIPRRPSGFQKGNPGSKGRPLPGQSRELISRKHKANGHRPSVEAGRRGIRAAIAARWRTHKKDPVDRWLKIYQKGAKSRNLEWGLLLEDFKSYVFDKCFFCEKQPEKRVYQGTVTYLSGIDRLDNKKGYTVENCVSCCTTCNRMKSSLTHREFVDQCRKIVEAYDRTRNSGRRRTRLLAAAR